MRLAVRPAVMLAAGIVLAVSSHPAFAEWDEATCVAQVQAAQARAETLPPEHLSRRFAETDLSVAILEMEAGDVDECEERVRRADEAVSTLRYVLKPGQTLDGYGPDAPR